MLDLQKLKNVRPETTSGKLFVADCPVCGTEGKGSLLVFPSGQFQCKNIKFEHEPDISGYYSHQDNMMDFAGVKHPMLNFELVFDRGSRLDGASIQLKVPAKIPIDFNDQPFHRWEQTEWIGMGESIKERQDSFMDSLMDSSSNGTMQLIDSWWNYCNNIIALVWGRDLQVVVDIGFHGYPPCCSWEPRDAAYALEPVLDGQTVKKYFFAPYKKETVVGRIEGKKVVPWWHKIDVKPSDS